MEMLPQYAGCELHRHIVARERHHFGPERDMQGVKRGALETAGIARKHQGALVVPRADSLRNTSKPHL